MDASEKLYIMLMLSFAFCLAFSITIGYLYMLGGLIEDYIPELYDVYHSYTMIGGLIGSASVLLTAGIYEVSQSTKDVAATIKRNTEHSVDDVEEETISCENCKGCVRPDSAEKETQPKKILRDYMYR